jgi:protein-disulfide isomerase
MSRMMFPLLVALAGCASQAAPAPVPHSAPAPLPFEVPPGGPADGAPAPARPPAAPPAPAAPAAPAAAPRPDPDDDPTVYRVPIGASPVLGKPTALVTIVEFGDFQCPFCARAESNVRILRERYGDKIRFVWKNQPLPFHKYAEPSAELALEVRAQRGDAAFWRVHDLLLALGGRIGDDDLAAAAQDAGLDPRAASRAVLARRHAQAIDDDVDLSDDVGASGTPAFFINGKKLVGAQPLDRFVALVDEQMAVAQAAVARGVPRERVYDELMRGAAPAALPDTVSVPAPTAASPSRGAADAKVVIQIWSDFECPFCLRVEPTLADLDAAFPGKIRVVWHNHPLPFHPHAELAAEAGLEAFAQKGEAGFWQMHDLILGHQGDEGQARPALEQYAAKVGLDMARFRAALDGGVHRAAVAADVHVAEGAGLTATPGFVINGYRLVGAQSIAKFKKLVRRALAEAR